ncbi:MAG TPA: hypothetical protein VK029_11715 [Pseudogracilibacillus sp.]|nr:hypothetical protein [Pseudogracilibacillus sp.]
MKKGIIITTMLTTAALIGCTNDTTTSKQNDSDIQEIEAADRSDHEETETTQDINKHDLYIDPSEPISIEYDPIDIAKALVKQEMQKYETDSDNWEIATIEITRDEIIDNVSDYDKPAGDIHIVWINGEIESDDGELIFEVGGKNFDLELYKRRNDKYWYIDEHWGILRDITTTDMPDVTEQNTTDASEQTDGKTFTFENAIRLVETEYDDEDIGITLEDEPKRDNGRTYYVGTIYSIDMQAAGGSGHLATIKVYEDGTIAEQFE